MLKLKGKEFYFLLPFYLVLFFIPLYKKVVSLLIVFLIVGTVYYLINSKRWGIIIKFSEINLYWFLLWVMFATSLLYTENIDAGVFDLQVKASMVIFSFFFSLKSIRDVLCKEFYHIIVIWIAGIFASFLYHIGFAVYDYIFRSHSFDSFFYTFLSNSFHPSYLSMYVVTGLIFLHEIMLRKRLDQLTNAIIIVVQFLLVLFVFLLSSKANIISLFLIYVLYTSYLIKQKRWTWFLGYFLVMIVLFIFFLLSFSVFRDRILQVVNFPSSKSLEQKKVQVQSEGGSTHDRYLIYLSSLQVIEKNLCLGVGVGDVKQELSKKYLQNNFKKGIEKRYNAHNQFLQNWLATGLVGFLLLLVVVFNIFRKGFYEQKIYLIAFGIVLFVNLMVESMLETQAGSVFIVLMSSFLMSTQEISG
ncbi:MAG: O-antigen ligase family protein [Bacteroidales bacterium]|nr:O-antigen ligase family protein [Bacteroidales bacterium]